LAINIQFICRRFPNTVPSSYEDGTECSETSAYKIRRPENYPEESIQHSEEGESLKSRFLCARIHTRPKSWSRVSVVTFHVTLITITNTTSPFTP